jgi:hypothetical protein
MEHVHDKLAKSIFVGPLAGYKEYFDRCKEQKSHRLQSILQPANARSNSVTSNSFARYKDLIDQAVSKFCFDKTKNRFLSYLPTHIRDGVVTTERLGLPDGTDIIAHLTSEFSKIDDMYREMPTISAVVASMRAYNVGRSFAKSRYGKRNTNPMRRNQNPAPISRYTRRMPRIISSKAFRNAILGRRPTPRYLLTRQNRGLKFRNEATAGRAPIANYKEIPARGNNQGAINTERDNNNKGNDRGNNNRGNNNN